MDSESGAACRHFFSAYERIKIKTVARTIKQELPSKFRMNSVCIFGEGRHDEGTHRRARSSTGGLTLKDSDCHYTGSYMASGHTDAIK